MDSAISWLKRSVGICNKIGIKEDYEDEEYDAFETLSSRYARAIDLIVRKVLRTIDLVEFEQPGTLIDTVNRAERRGLVDNVNELRNMTDLRNEIAHDYIMSELVGTFGNILNQTPQVIALAQRIKDYAVRYVNTDDT
ncbi:MAG: hypothetical protein GY777_20960 [Candidatus Brocadiaceae bacterium]|nr:hypothetical protein [Candidatus Brocadiaceae bacterium]